MIAPRDQLELFSDVDLDDLSWEEWFIALPPTPEPLPRPDERFTGRLELFSKRERRAA
jgi:hypothetical protein